MSAACKSCRAPVRWVATSTGGRMPLNPEPELGGNVELGEDGLARVVKPSPGVKRYTSHFSNCPDAAAHRKERR